MASLERRPSTPGTPTTAAQPDLKVGSRVEYQGKAGTIRYVGTTSFSTGKWIGVELDDASGKNSGVVQGKRYFECRTNHGVFVRRSQIKLLSESQSQRPESPEKESPKRSSTGFAPPPDPNLAAAAAAAFAQRGPSVSSTLLPSRIGSPSTRPTKAGTTTPPGSRRGTMIVTPKAAPSMTLKAPRKHSVGASARPELELASKHSSVVEEPEPVEEEPIAEEVEDEEEEEEAIEEEERIIEEELDSAQEPESTPLVDTIVPEPSRTTTKVDPFSLHGPVSLRSDQTVPLKDYDELRFKLTILEKKRAEDRERIRDLEKFKEDASDFVTVKKTLQDKLTSLQKDLREEKRERTDAQSEKESLELKCADLAESMEMMTLDKEMAEERAENLQQEVNLLKEKIEEISVDLDVFKKEGDIINRAQDYEGDAKPSVEVIQLEKQNERLKEALVRLRDMTTEQEAELKERIKILEKDNAALHDAYAQNERYKELLGDAEARIQEAKERMDISLASEDMVEQLTEKNLDLKEKLEELRTAVEDLEALKEANDELEEGYIENMKQLQAEIDHKDMLLREQFERIRSSEDTNADYESTIAQFRELVANLQHDIEQLRYKEQSQLSETRILSSQTHAMLSINMQLQSTVIKTQAKAIDLELRRLEAQQATDNLAYVKPYLPESFFKNENDSICAVLLFKRLVFKSDLIIKHLDQNYNVSEKLASTIPERLAVVCEMKQKTGWLADLAKQFVAYIEHCSVETFLKMGQVYHELVGAERRLNAIIELLRTEELNDEDSLSELQRIIARLDHLADLHMSSGRPVYDQYYAFSRGLDFSADHMTVNLSYLLQNITQSLNDEGNIDGRLFLLENEPSLMCAMILATENKTANVADELRDDFVEPCSRLIAQAKSSKVMARKIIRRLEDLSEAQATLKPDLLERFQNLYNKSNKLSTFCLEACKRISDYIQNRRVQKEVLVSSAIQQILFNMTEDLLNINETAMWDGGWKFADGLCQELVNVNHSILDDGKVEKVENTEAPWVRRASYLKQEVVVNHDMERKLQLNGEEILRLAKDIKLKPEHAIYSLFYCEPPPLFQDQSLQESTVKIQLLEKRSEVIKKQVHQNISSNLTLSCFLNQADQIKALEEELDKTRDQERSYREACDSLSKELDELTATMDDLKRSKKAEKQSTTPRKSEFDINSSLEGDTYDNLAVKAQLDSLKSAVRYLRAENARLKRKEVLQGFDLAVVPGLKLEQTQEESEKTEQAKNLLKSVALETKVLIKV
ncbi:dynein associated protein-domain-containing protein [Endogone sp. FLAS-F59071]|nr:dynein associated protein-domain-containing protein [Endogone sp. FLAS-F59071]|eukprot:RUS21843.1 dynein associated protein-domain-containing protein [Endogone sp. FLAS-F59071]